MKMLGLIKWFAELRGFGKIGTTDEKEIFIHQNQIINKPGKIAKGTPFIFEIRTERKGLTAINARKPETYEDFKLILSYLSTDPSIQIEVAVSGKSRMGNPYKRNEFRSIKIIDYALDALLKAHNGTTIFDYFKRFYDEKVKAEELPYLNKYFSITETRIKTLTLKLDNELLVESESKHSSGNSEDSNSLLTGADITPNNYLIRKLFSYYSQGIKKEWLFELWKADSFKISTFSSFGQDEDRYEMEVELSAEIFEPYYGTLTVYDLKRIRKLRDGEEIVKKVIEHRIENFSEVVKKDCGDILTFITQLSDPEIIQRLQRNFVSKLLQLVLSLDLSGTNEEAISQFKLFKIVLNDNKIKFDTSNVINDFNSKVDDNVKFVLWQQLRYFRPEKSFFYNHIAQLSFSDFLRAPEDFHKEYFADCFEQIKTFSDVQHFILLSFLIVETPFKALTMVFTQLPPVYQAAYWLNFPIHASFWHHRKSYEVNYEAQDIPFSEANFIHYINSLTSLTDLQLYSLILEKVQELYRSRRCKHDTDEGFFKLDLRERISIGDSFLKDISELSSEKSISLLKAALVKCRNETCVSIFKSFIPKFIDKKMINGEVLIEIVNTTNAEQRFKQEIFSYICENHSTFQKVSFWLNGYIKTVALHEVIDVFNEFDMAVQPTLFRKLFSLIHRNKSILSTEQSALFRLSENGNINFHLKICLKVLQALTVRQDFIGENILSEIITRHVNENVTGLIQITDMFQECYGRTRMAVGDEYTRQWYLNIEGSEFVVDNDHVVIGGNYYQLDKESRTVEIEAEIYSFRWVKKGNSLVTRRYEIPTGVTFCDAVKSQRDEAVKRNFYWCCNGKCYAPCQTDHNHLQWRDYSLRDFIKILNISFDDDKYYRFVSIINRANRLLKKLACQSCNHLLRDARTSEFAFYRVTTFHCTNAECHEFHKPVYLTHCLNWRCLNVVDSRISTTCPNGWYICDACSNCCSQDKLEKRLKALMANGAFDPGNPRHQKLKYQVDNKLGHTDRGEIFDFKTGQKSTR